MNQTIIINNPVYESPIFLANIAATEPVVGNQGGTWSGKTFSILQVLFYLTLSTEYYDKEGRREPIVTTVVGQDIPNLKKGAITDFDNVVDIIINSFPENCRHFFKHQYNKTDKVAEIEGQYMGLIKFTPNGWNQVQLFLTRFDSKKIDKMDTPNTQ